METITSSYLPETTVVKAAQPIRCEAEKNMIGWQVTRFAGPKNDESTLSLGSLDTGSLGTVVDPGVLLIKFIRE